MLCKTQKEVVLEIPNSSGEEKPPTKEYLHWDYRVRGEYYYSRPYFDDYVKFLASHCKLSSEHHEKPGHALFDE